MGQEGFYLQSGIRWNEYGWSQTVQSYVWNGGTYDVSQDDIKITFFYLTLPLIATYKFKKNVPGLTLSTGPQMSLFMFNKINGNITSDPWPPFFNFSAHFSLGYEHNLGDKWIVGGEAFSNLIFPFEAYNFGIGISGRYILK